MFVGVWKVIKKNGFNKSISFHTYKEWERRTAASKMGKIYFFPRGIDKRDRRTGSRCRSTPALRPLAYPLHVVGHHQQCGTVLTSHGAVVGPEMYEFRRNQCIEF